MKISDILENMPDLPATPQLLPKLQRLLHNPEVDTSEVTEVIRLDANLTVQIIRLSNSGYYGSSQTCHSVDEAIRRIGFNEVYKLVGALATLDLFSSELPLYRTTAQAMWMHSVTSAALMRILAPHVQRDADDAYTIGLLSSLGKVLLNHYYLYNGIDGFMETSMTFTPQLEFELLGFTHAHVAAELLKKWNFPNNTCEAVYYQSYPNEAPTESVLAHLLSLCHEAQVYMAIDDHSLLNRFPKDHKALVELGLDLEVVVDAALDAQNAVLWLSESL